MIQDSLPTQVLFLCFLEQNAHLALGEEGHQNPGAAPLYHSDHPGHVRSRVRPGDGLRVLHTHALVARGFDERRQAAVAVVVVAPDCPDPHPAKAFDQFGQRSALMEVARDRPEKEWVLLSVAQTSASCKVADLVYNKAGRNRNFLSLWKDRLSYKSTAQYKSTKFALLL